MQAVTKQLWIAIVLYFLTGYINEFAAENQVYHNITNPPLYDRGHNFLPLLPKFIPDVGLVGLLMYFIVRWGITHPTTLVNYLWIISLLFIGRVLLLTATQVPPAVPGCSTVRNNEPLHYRIFSKGWNECMDYMYSGHTIHCVLIALFTLYLSTSIFEKTTIVLITIAELIVIIASRIHYTADVLVGTLVTILIFFSWPGVHNLLSHIHRGGIYGAYMQSMLAKLKVEQ
jgi:hypothetical protein